MIIETPPPETLDQPSSVGRAARGRLVLASIAFGGGMPCLGEKYLDDAVNVLQLALEVAAAQRS